LTHCGSSATTWRKIHFRANLVFHAQRGNFRRNTLTLVARHRARACKQKTFRCDIAQARCRALHERVGLQPDRTKIHGNVALARVVGGATPGMAHVPMLLQDVDDEEALEDRCAPSYFRPLFGSLNCAATL
jgi:hypothetical protein